MRSYLIVANQTLTSEALLDEITARRADGPVGADVVVPMSAGGGRLSWDEGEARATAQARLDDMLERLKEMDIEADGEVGDRDPVNAVRDAIRRQEVDEVIVSTLPRGLSRWLGEDVPSRLRDACRVPVTVVSQSAPQKVST